MLRDFIGITTVYVVKISIRINVTLNFVILQVAKKTSPFDILHTDFCNKVILTSSFCFLFNVLLKENILTSSMVMDGSFFSLCWSILSTLATACVIMDIWYLR